MTEAQDPTSLIGKTCRVTEMFVKHWNNNCNHPCPYSVGSFIHFNTVTLGEEIPNCGIRKSEVGYNINLNLLPLLGYTLVEVD